MPHEGAGFSQLDTSAERDPEAVMCHFGLILVKQDSLAKVFDPLLIETFRGNIQPVFQSPSCDFVERLPEVELCGVYYRDLSQVPYGNSVIQLFYGNMAGQRRWKIIQDEYRGPAAFLLLGSRQSQATVDSLLSAAKGTAATFDGECHPASEARGIRGALQIPYRHYTYNEVRNMNVADYRAAVLPAIQNIIHVPDSVTETARALQHILSPNDLNTLQRRGCAIREFFDRNITDSSLTVLTDA